MGFVLIEVDRVALHVQATWYPMSRVLLQYNALYSSARLKLHILCSLIGMT